MQPLRRTRANPYSGITRLGQLGCKHPNGNSFSPEDVQRMMWALWVEYVIANPQLFESAELRCADTGAAGSNWPGLTNTNRGGIILSRGTGTLVVNST